MQSFVNLLAIAGLLMTLLLGFLAVKVISGGLKRRASGLGEGLPRWPDVPAGWVPVEGEPLLVDDPEPWPEGTDWKGNVLEHCPEGHPYRPHAFTLAPSSHTLLYLPGRHRGVNGWWVLLLRDRDK